MNKKIIKWLYSESPLSFEKDVKCGFYVPNNPDMTSEDITFVCDIINKEINK